VPVMKQMVDVAARENASVIGVMDVAAADVGSYGIVDAPTFSGQAGRIDAIVEKPKPADAPSTLAVVGRYILNPRIFDLLESTQSGAGGEIQLTDAIARLLPEQEVDAFRFHGTRFDCGTHLGLIEATVRRDDATAPGSAWMVKSSRMRSRSRRSMPLLRAAVTLSNRSPLWTRS